MIELGLAESIVLGLLAGITVGGVYFGGLWLTVRRMPSATAPIAFYFGSLVVRIAILLATFLTLLKLVGASALIATLVGFLAARIGLTLSCSYRRQTVDATHETGPTQSNPRSGERGYEYARRTEVV